MYKKAVEGWVIMVIGVYEEANKVGLQEMFSGYGSVTDLAMTSAHRTGYVKLIGICIS